MLGFKVNFSSFCSIRRRKSTLFPSHSQENAKKISKFFHYGTCRPSGKEFLHHVVHIRGYMLEENAVTGTEIIESWFAIGCLEETQTRTFAVTGLKPLTLTTLARKCFLLQAAETILLGAVKHLWKTVCANVSQLVLREDKMVARIDIAVLLHYCCMTAFLGINTNAWSFAQPASQSRIEKLHT